MNKIRTLIINDDKKAINDIKECLEGIEYVEVVGECIDSKDALETIVNLKPNAVFTKYKMKNYNPIEIMTETSNKLGKETPIFKFVSNDLSSETKIKSYKDKSKNKKVKNIYNIKELNKDEILDVLKEYYKEMK